MSGSVVISKAYQDKGQRLNVELCRVGLYLIILSVGIFSYLYQSDFVDWRVLSVLMTVTAVGFFSHGVISFFIDELPKFPKLLTLSFVLDIGLIAIVIWFSRINQSLFLFFFLLNILLAGFALKRFGAFSVACLTSLCFSILNLYLPDIRSLSQILIILLNNISFFAVAFLADYLSSNMETIYEELKATGLSLKSVEDLNVEVIENIPVGLVTFDDSGTIFQHNQIFKTFISLNSKDGHQFRGRNIFELWPGVKPIISEVRNLNVQDRMPFDYVLRDSREGPSVSEVRGARSDSGEARSDSGEATSETGYTSRTLVMTLSRVLNSVINRQLFILLAEDVTKVRTLEASSRQNEKLAAIGGLAAGIAHEIRNPLASISGSVELLSQTTQAEDDRKLMKIILKEIDRLNRLITEFLDYARPDDGDPKDSVDLVSILNEIVSSLKADKVLSEGVKFDLNLPPTLIIQAQRDKLKQALLNIIINGLQAMFGRSSKVMSITLNVPSLGPIELNIKDTGAGIPADVQKRIFEPFYTTKTKGTGLGLAVTHKILQSHKIKAKVQSTPNIGTSFCLEIWDSNTQLKC